MAALDDLKNRLATLKLDVDRLQQRVQGVEAAAREARSAANSRNFQLPGQEAEFKAARARATAAEKDLEVAQADLSSAELEISNLQNEIAAAERADANAPAQSTGETTAQAQQAQDEGALSQNPPTANDDAPPPTNADSPVAEPTTGVNGELRPISSTQGGTTAAPGGPTPGNYAGDADAQPGGFYGAGAPSDDSGAGLNPVAQAVQRIYGGAAEPIIPRANPLDRCASYTYSITIYLASPAAYSGLLTNKKKSVSGMTVLIRSGGINSVASATLDPQEVQQIADGQSAAAPDASRNNNFPLDFYIDNLQIKSIVNGKGTMSAHNAVEINFRITEPNGISLIQNLQAASAQMAGELGVDYKSVKNFYLSQVYLMAIRFYGWDENGNPVAPTPEIAAQQSDRTAVTEKFIPFLFSNIRFKIANRLTEYECSAVAVPNMIATSQQRGVIPYNFQVTSSTLPGVMKDLSKALNDYQVSLKTADPAAGRPEPVFTHADEYEIVLTPPELWEKIALKPPGDTLNTQTAMGPSAQKDPRAALPSTQSVKSDTKLNSAFAGMSIVQFIDQMVRQSEYIYQQQTFIYDPKQDKMVRQSGAGSIFAWYRIGVQSEPMLTKWDSRRRDYAYKITYQITPYLVTDVQSDYFPQNSFLKGQEFRVPKEYYYWFTGQNNSILDFTQEFNNLYFFVANAPQPPVSDSQLKNESKKGYQPNSNISSAGMPGKVNEPGANAAQFLYSPSDLARARMTIVGDPDWIQQGDVWAGIDASGTFNAAAVYKSGPDAGGINYTSRETLFDIIFKTPVDYDLNTGLITDPSATTPGPIVNGTPRMLESRARYKAVTVTNNFSQGKFTQDIEGVLVLPDVEDANQKTAQKSSEKSVVSVSSGSPTLSGSEYTNFRKLEIAQQNASAKPTDWAQGYKDRLPTGASSTSMAAQLNSAATTPNLLLSSAPTSGGEVVGPASSGDLAVRSLGGASGSAVGQPVSVQAFTNSGPVNVSSNQEIQTLFNQGKITAQERSQVAAALNLKQRAANSPISTAPLQRGSKEY